MLKLRNRDLFGHRILQSEWFVALLLYVMLIAFHGYRFGDQDMSETLSYAKYLWNETLYPHDFYVQSVAEHWLNERLPFTLILAPGKIDWEWYCLGAHFITTLLFIIALKRITDKYLSGIVWRWIFLLGFFFVSYKVNLGGNEAWYNYFVPSHLAKVFGIWSLYFFLERKENRSFIILIFSTLAQPVVGAQLALIFGLIVLFEWIRSPEKGIRGWKGMFALFFTAGIWVLGVFWHHLLSDHSINRSDYFEMMEWRLGHHFFPSYFPETSWITLTPLILIGTVIWYKIDKRVFAFFVISIAGMILYTIFIELLEIPEFLSLQWFKTTVWLKPLGLLALIYAFSKLFHGGLVQRYPLRWIVPLFLVFALVPLLKSTALWRTNVPYHLPWKSYYTDEMQLGVELQRHLPTDAVLLTPPQITGLRFFSERSIYVDYKSNIHSRKYMAEASRRRQKLYGMHLTWRREGRDMVQAGQKFYENLGKTEFEAFKKEGATHVVAKQGREMDLEIAIQTDSFIVYSL